MKNEKRKVAFTLSEVIITLVVIGIVAAITVPIMSNSAHGKKWNVARQKAQATIGEAFRLMTVNNEITTSKTTAQFVEQVIPKYLKLAKTCGSGYDNAEKCGWKKGGNTVQIKRLNGVTVNLPLTWSTSTLAYGGTGTVNDKGYLPTRSTNNPTTSNYNESYFFQTIDGFSVNFFYNPYCAIDDRDKITVMPEDGGNAQTLLDSVCMMGVYDMNGKKGPNQTGKDIGFVGSFYNGYSVKSVTILPYSKSKKLSSGNVLKQSQNYCKSVGEKGEWVIPNISELSLLFLNNTISFNINSSGHHKVLSSTPWGNPLTTRYGVNFNSKRTMTSYYPINPDDGYNYYVYCVRANALK